MEIESIKREIEGNGDVIAVVEEHKALRQTKVEIGARARDVARRLLWKQPHSEIMRELELSEAQFRYIRNHDTFKQVFAEVEQELWDELDSRFKSHMTVVQRKALETAEEAFDKLVSLMRQAPSQALQRDCANDIIEYSGQAAKKKEPRIAINISHAQIALLTKAIEEDEQRRFSP
jgi:hypothetical protein